MKKKLIALVLSIVMVTGSLGAAPAFAVETTVTEAAPVEEGVAEDQEEVSEDAAVDVVAVEVPEDDTAETVEESGQEFEESFEESESTVEQEVEEGGGSTGAAVAVDGVRKNSSEEVDEPVFEEDIVAPEKNEAVGAAVASGTCGSDLNWTLDNSGTLKITGTGAMSDYSDSNQASYNSPWYPYCASVTKVVLTYGITHIGNHAFYSCSNLYELELPNSVTSLGYCFLEDSSVSSIRIPASVSSCNTHSRYFSDLNNYGPFAGSNVTEVIFAEGTKVIPDYICKGEPYINQIGDIDYYDTIVNTVVIPEGVETIGEGAFGECYKLEEIRIPFSVTEIKVKAFLDRGGRSSLYDVYYGGSEEEWGNIKIDAGNDPLLNADIHFEDKNSLKLADQFTGAEGEEILITAEIKSSEVIPDEGNIEWVVSPLEGQIGKITWGSASVESNGGDSYTAKRSVIIDEEGKYSLSVSFGNLSETAELLIYCWKLENGTLTVYSNRPMKVYSDSSPAPWYGQRKDIEHIVIKDNVDLISGYAFSGCSNAKDVSIGKNVKSIGDYAFRSCYSLLDPALPEGIEAIGGGAYQNCYSMRNVIIPSSVREMGENPFAVFLQDGEERYPSAISLSEITVAQGNQYFAAEDGILYDKSVKKLICYPAGKEGELFAIPNTVETIGQKAFANCTVLKNVSVPEQVSYIGDFAFASYSNSGKSYMSVEAVCFMKDAPGFAPNSFYKYSKHAYYLLNNATWTDSVKQNYGGSVIWENDQDLDGIPDGWELCGADFDNDSVIDLDFPKMGASIEYPDIFVEIDWMVGYEPMASALNRVCEKFNDHDIHLHIDAGPESVDYVTGNKWGQMSYGGSTIPYSQYFDLANGNGPLGNWVDTALAHMGPNRISTFHHFFFVNHMRDSTGGYTGTSGATIIDGQLSIVADIDGWISGRSLKITHLYTFGKNTAQAGTFMHELGHSLGLAHASTTVAYSGSQYDDNISYQPNHLSIMNYAFQTRGFIGDSYDGSDFDINYSEYELPAIDENNVDETLGIDPFSVITDKNVHTRWHYIDSHGSVQAVGAGNLAGKSIDFNRNHSNKDKGVQIDLNDDGQYTVMTPSVNEWKILEFYSGQIGSGADIEDAEEQIRDKSIEIPEEYSEDMEIKRQSIPEEEYIAPEPDLVASGDLTDTVSWKLDENGVLTVYGEGPMADYGDPYAEGGEYEAPWADYRDDIRRIVIGETVESAGSFAFVDCPNCTSVTIPQSVLRIGTGAFRGCASLPQIGLPQGIERIEDWAFNECDSLTSVVIPESVVYLGSYCFAWCDSLESVVIPDSVEEGGINIFGEDNALSDVTMGNGLTCVPQGIFYACTALEQITIPEGVEELSYCVFEECSSLKSINLPESLESVYEDAFRECGDLRSVYYGGTRAQWKEVEIDAGNNNLRTQMIRCTDGNLKLLTTSMVSLGRSIFTYSGNAFEPTVIVKNGSTTLKEGTHYTVKYSNNTVAGTATVSVTGKGSTYWGTVKKTFTILPGKTTRGDMFNLANNVKVTWKEVPGAKYYKVYREGVTDPSESIDEPVIVTTGLIGWDKQPGLTNGHAYRYRIVASLTGAGDDGGDSPLSYSKLMYRLKTVVIRSVKNTAPGAVTVKYDKSTSGDSYVLQYSENEDMSNAKTKVVLGANTTSYVIGGLKKGKTYYISIRVRKKVDGIDYYTTFGVAKKIKITQ